VRLRGSKPTICIQEVQFFKPDLFQFFAKSVLASMFTPECFPAGQLINGVDSIPSALTI
jgi:hypothetical protein